MADIFVIAEEEIVLAFRMAGAEGRVVSGREEALEAFREALASEAKVLVLTEEVSDMIGDEAASHQAAGEYPLLVELPGQDGRRPGRKSLDDLVREAIGVAI